MNLRTLDNFPSRAVAALVLCALVNVWLVIAHPLAHVPTANLDTGEVARAIAAYCKEIDHTPADVPRIALLGSSLMLAPAMQAEAEYLQSPIERMNHRRSAFAESLFAGASRVFCLAIGGEMVSDDYLLVEHVLNGKYKPDAIIFGIAPRDFQDNALPGIQSTESFKTLSRVHDGVDLIARGHLPFEPAADVILSDLCPLWKYRADLRTYALLRSKKLMEASLPWVVFDKYGDTLELKPRKHGTFPEEVHGTPVVLPRVAMMHTTPDQTRLEYIRRYNPPNFALIEQEFGYLERLLSLCRQRDIKVMLVNMPLSSGNLDLMPNGFYAEYRRRLAHICATKDVDLVDMCTPAYTNTTLYADGVHLDTGISQQFLRSVCRQFASSRLASKISKNI